MVFILIEMLYSYHEKKKQMKSKEWGNRIKKNVYFISTARELMAEERAGFKVMFGMSLHDFESVKKTC